MFVVGSEHRPQPPGGGGGAVLFKRIHLLNLFIIAEIKDLFSFREKRLPSCMT